MVKSIREAEVCVGEINYELTSKQKREEIFRDLYTSQKM